MTCSGSRVDSMFIAIDDDLHVVRITICSVLLRQLVDDEMLSRSRSRVKSWLGQQITDACYFSLCQLDTYAQPTLN